MRYNLLIILTILFIISASFAQTVMQSTELTRIQDFYATQNTLTVIYTEGIANKMTAYTLDNSLAQRYTLAISDINTPCSLTGATTTGATIVTTAKKSFSIDTNGLYSTISTETSATRDGYYFIEPIVNITATFNSKIVLTISTNNNTITIKDGWFHNKKIHYVMPIRSLQWLPKQRKVVLLENEQITIENY